MDLLYTLSVSMHWMGTSANYPSLIPPKKHYCQRDGVTFINPSFLTGNRPLPLPTSGVPCPGYRQPLPVPRLLLRPADLAASRGLAGEEDVRGARRGLLSPGPRHRAVLHRGGRCPIRR